MEHRVNGERPEEYAPQEIEEKWQQRWRDQGTNVTDIRGAADPYYALMMFPYPSAEGLHVGNLFAFVGNDIYGRFQRLQGHNVFEPFGYDAFGIHSENYALSVGKHPSTLIPQNIANFERQVKRAGLMIDWTHSLATTDPDYYKWTQWVFLQLLKKGLAYKKQAAVNWCPSCKTVLANEQVIGGRCERCDTPVEQRSLSQWFFKISEYAPRLLANLDHLDWSESTKTAQRNWIGRSEGAEIAFPVETSGGVEKIRVFTTRPDTIFGATYMVLAPEHPLVERLTTPDHRASVEAYLERTAKQDLVTRKTSTEKTGSFTGSYAINPATGQKIPVWIADYVLMEYGTGAIMAVPAHDDRDFEFAMLFGLPIVRVVCAEGDDPTADVSSPFTGGDDDAKLLNSGPFDGLSVEEGKRAIVAMLAEKGAAKPVVNFRLHDWCISRQRYWGPPIPIIYCDVCGAVPVPEKDLPVVLPYVEDFKPDDSGVSPLARHEKWYHVPCPQCGAQGRRETDVSDTFLDSAWYFLRYPTVGIDDAPFDSNLTRKWLPVDTYIGGNEHAVLHLLYSRFVTMVLHDMGYLEFEEPYVKFRAHGLIIRNGAKMSKSRGNVVIPDEYIATWGADAFRGYLMFLGPFEEGGDFRDASISGVRRFLDRLWASVLTAVEQNDQLAPAADSTEVARKLHQTIKKVGDDIPRLSYNTAIAAMMEYMNVLRRGERVPRREEVEPVVQLVAPFAPHIAEELWERLGHGGSIFDAGWPAFDVALVADERLELVIQVNGKTRGRVHVARDIGQDEAVAAALAEESIAKFLSGPAPRKIIFVPGRLLNLVG